MKTENPLLQAPRKVSYAQFALIALVLFLAMKVCTLPSVLAEEAGAKSVWAALFLFLTDCILLYFAMKTAKQGGLFSLDIPRGWKIAAGIPLLLFFALKLSAFSREVSTYFALSLFESVPVLPISVILLVFLCLFADKGFAAIGRTLEIFVWLFLFVFLFVIIFTRTEGDLFNALAIFSPDLDKVGGALFRCLGWYGDTTLLLLLDLREPPAVAPKKKNAPIFATVAFSFLSLLVFYVVFTAVYGEAAKMTDYAFIKLSAFKANTDELGSADWPMITLWSVLSFSYLALILLAGKECLLQLFRKEGKKAGRWAFAALSLFALLFSFFLLDEEKEYHTFMTKAMNLVTLAAGIVTIASGAAALYKEKYEKTN
ncbi:MAG: GerAB/ArcD/ProY family transporter [Clostridia bacterium]|nr:GerAB/ArcD/ProY family transporter [Clostridia bacterium]